MTRPPEMTRRSAGDRILDVTEALLWVGLLALGSVVALEVMREPGDSGAAVAALAAPEDLIEAETLPVLASSRKFGFWLQPTGDFRTGRWSEDGHMFAFDTEQGDWIDLELPDGEPGPRLLELYMTRAPDYGLVAVSLNGERVGEPLDLFSHGIEPSGRLDLGNVTLRGHGDVLRLELVGHNPAASPPFHQFGIDGVRLAPPEVPLPEDLIEAETLPVLASSRSFLFWLQPTKDFRAGRWSEDGHMFAVDTEQGDWIDLELPDGEPGPRRLELYMTRAPDYGLVAVSLNGERVGEPLDLFSQGIEPSGRLDLGSVTLRGHGDVLRLEVVGHNPAASPPFHQFGIDGIRLAPPEKSPEATATATLSGS